MVSSHSGKDFKIVIPARWGSSRFPGKVLTPILGKPMLGWVLDHAIQAWGRDRVGVAVDEEKVLEFVRGYGVTVLMTSSSLVSGTDRVFQFVNRLGWDDSTWVMNLQADEPAIDPELLREMGEWVLQRDDGTVATFVTKFRDSSELKDLNKVKVILSSQGKALSFSRFPIPYSRERIPEAGPWISKKHLGVYAYQVKTLRRICQHESTSWERAEALEQLRLLELGIDIYAQEIPYQAHGVDVPQDVEGVEKFLKPV